MERATATASLGLGCAALYRAPSRTQRRQVLEAAWEAGIRHFDVAPMYGLGVAERELGRFLADRREQAVIATKFGILPTAAARGIARVQAPVRRLLARSEGLQRQARTSAAGPMSGPAGPVLYRAAGFTAQGARASLERSLRELGTDYVDLLLAHDPRPGAVDSEELAGFLEHARGQGVIRSWGIAGEPEPSYAVARELPVPVPVLQIRDDLLDRPAAGIPEDASGTRITFGALGSSIGRIVAHIGSDPARRQQWHESVGRDCADPQAVALLLLAWASRQHPSGVVLFGSSRVEHVHIVAGGLAHGEPLAPAPPGDVDAFVRLVGEQLTRATSRAEG